MHAESLQKIMMMNLPKHQYRRAFCNFDREWDQQRCTSLPDLYIYSKAKSTQTEIKSGEITKHFLEKMKLKTLVQCVRPYASDGAITDDDDDDDGAV